MRHSTRIGVLCGGFSSEREVSLRSGKNVHAALLRLGYDAIVLDPAVDTDFIHRMNVAFNVLHGQFGEDGTVQALLEQFGIAYTGSGVSASLLCMNKFSSKSVFSEKKIPQTEYLLLRKSIDVLPDAFTFPVVLKPIDQGSSIGVEIVHDLITLKSASERLLNCYGTYLLEAFISGMEVTVGVVEMPEKTALPILEIRPKKAFYDYEAKYTANMTEFVCPALLSHDDTRRIQDIAIDAYNALGCRGYARVDLKFDPIKGPLVLEINTVPGMTDTSDLPQQAKAAGLSFDQLVDLILKQIL